MPNPFTRFLRQWSNNVDFEAFVEKWDELEWLMVQVYREKLSPQAAQAQFTAVWSWLRQHYGVWEEDLRPFWQATRAAGEPAKVDPFRLLLEIPAPQAILGDWQAMQHLPAAREAINQYILDQA